MNYMVVKVRLSHLQIIPQKVNAFNVQRMACSKKKMIAKEIETIIERYMEMKNLAKGTFLSETPLNGECCIL